MSQKVYANFNTTYKYRHSISWQAVMLGCLVFMLLHAAVAMAFDATTMAISTVMMGAKNGLPRSNATIFCKTPNPANTYFYDMSKEKSMNPSNITNDLPSPYAVLFLDDIRQNSTYQCWLNETSQILLSETFVSTDILRHSLKVTSDGNTEILCKTPHPANTLFYDVYKEIYIKPSYIGNDMLFRVWVNTNSRCFLKNKLGTYEAENRVNLKMKANDKIKDFLRRSLTVGLYGNAAILCKTPDRANTYFYDVAKERYMPPSNMSNIENDLLNPYAVLVLENIRQNSTYQCWLNETQLLSETFLSIDATTQTVRIEMGIGDDAALICKHDEDKKIYFTQTRTINGNGRPGDTDVVEINSKTSLYLIRNVSEQITTFSCTYMENERRIDESLLHVGTPPPKVKNFTCLGDNYHRMTCEFPNTNNILPKYELTYSVDSLTDLEKNCALRYTNNTEILVLETSVTETPCQYIPAAKKYKFYLVAKNVLGELNQNFTVPNHENVKPPKLEINIVNITSNSVKLNWTDDRRSSYILGVIYDIYVKPADVVVVVIKSSDNEVQLQQQQELKGYSATSLCTSLQCEMPLTNLPYANWNYTITIKARVNTNLTIRWNEPSSVSFATLKRIPDRAPKTVVGGFYISDNSNNDEITLYWEKLAKYEENGPEFGYNIQELDINGKVLNSKRSNGTATTFPWSNEERIFEVRAVNAEGESYGASRIRADNPKTTYAPREIEHLFYENNKKYKLTWKHPVDYKQQPPTNYTVFWCRARQASRKECEGTMHFQVVNSSTTEFDIDSKDQEITTAVAANYPNWSTGMHWRTCTGRNDEGLEKVQPEAVALSASIITLKWRLEETCIKAFETYQIRYCEVDLQKCDWETLDNTGIKEYNLTNLKPYTEYNITMFLKADSKLYQGDSIICQTKEAAPDPPTNLRFDNASLTNNSLNIFWDAPKVTNGILKKYTIWYANQNLSIVENEDVPIENLTYDGNTGLTFNLKDLSSFSTYKIWVTAWTSEESKTNENETLQITTLIGRPSKPLTVSLTSVDDYYILKWTDPKDLSGRVELYELTFIEGDEKRVTFVPRGLKQQEHKCRLKPHGCTNTTKIMEVRAINLVTEKELEQHTFPIEDGTVQRRRRYTKPAIITGPVPIQTPTSADKVNKNKLDRKHIIMDEYHKREEFKCELLYKTKPLETFSGIKYYMIKSEPEFGNINCAQPPWGQLVAALVIVGVILVTGLWSYNFFVRQSKIIFIFPDPVENLIKISANKADNPTDTRHENDLSNKPNIPDYSSNWKEDAILLNLTPSSSESGVHGVDGTDGVSCSSDHYVAGETYLPQRVPQDEIGSSESITTLNEPSLSSNQHSPLQRKFEQIKDDPLKNDSYLIIDHKIKQKPVDASISPSESSYLPLHKISSERRLPNSVPNNITAIPTNSTPVRTQQTIVVTSPPKPTVFSNYLPHNFLSTKNTSTQPKVFTSLALSTGDYVLPDALPQLAASHQAASTSEENDEQSQKPLQQQTNPIVSYGYVTSDFWSKPNTMK